MKSEHPFEHGLKNLLLVLMILCFVYGLMLTHSLFFEG